MSLRDATMSEEGLFCKQVTPAEVVLCPTCRQTSRWLSAANTAPMAPCMQRSWVLCLKWLPRMWQRSSQPMRRRACQLLPLGPHQLIRASAYQWEERPAFKVLQQACSLISRQKASMVERALTTLKVS